MSYWILAQQDPFNQRMVNFLDSVRSWLQEDAEYAKSGQNNLIGDVKTWQNKSNV